MEEAQTGTPNSWGTHSLNRLDVGDP